MLALCLGDDTHISLINIENHYSDKYKSINITMRNIE